MLVLLELFVPLTVPATLLVDKDPAFVPARTPTSVRPVTLAPVKMTLRMVPAAPTWPKSATFVAVGLSMESPLIASPFPLKVPVKPLMGANPAPEFQVEVLDAFMADVTSQESARRAALLPIPCSP